jgi:hypothetical protein
MSVHEHRDDAQLSQDIWDGNYWDSNGAVARKQAKYNASSRTVADRVEWMSALYSALTRVWPSAKRGNPLSFYRIVWCVWKLKPFVSYFCRYKRSDGIDEFLSAEECDVISTVILRWSDLPLLKFYGRERYLSTAEVYAQAACSRPTNKPHTKPLALLTLAYIYSKASGKRNKVNYCLGIATERVPLITDNNQRARVYRRIADLTIRLYGSTDETKRTARTMMDRADSSAEGADVKAKNSETRRVLGL